jgi:hypothetical protein
MIKVKYGWLVLAAALFAAGCEQPEYEYSGGGGTGNNPGTGTGNNPGNGTDDELDPVPVITGITLLSLPDTTIYSKNATFSPAGLAVAYTWDNGDTTEIPAGGYTLSQPNMAKCNPQTLTVSAGGYSATFAINVMDSNKILESVSVSGPANKVNRFGSDFDKDGLLVTGHYSNSTTGDVTPYAAITGYDKRKRGAQDVSVRVNGKTASVPGVSIRVPADMSVTLAVDSNSTNTAGYRRVYLKGESMDVSRANFNATAVTASGQLTINYGLGNLLESDSVTGFDPNVLGKQNAVLHLDDAEVEFLVSVVDVAPEVWFDYGYRRTPSDPGGKGPGAGVYYARPNETLVLSPVRFLVGYDRDHKDTGVTYSWSVSGGSFSSPASATGEFYSFTPTAAGTTTVTVSVTGNNYITGQPVTETATTGVVCYTQPAQGSPQVSGAGPHNRVYLHHAPGQYATGGSGYGWSLGSFGGYEVWKVNHQDTYYIRGNPFAGWSEPGVIWVQEDRNGNGIPDEMWYELKGSADYLPQAQNPLSRRYALTYINDYGVETLYSNDGSPSVRKYWVDSRGSTGLWYSYWHSDWPERITFTGTRLNVGGDLWGYVDVYDLVGGPPGDTHPSFTFPIHRAIKADGSPVTLTDVRFIKVHTAEFSRSVTFGDISTEIHSADFLGTQTDFPLPEDS